MKKITIVIILFILFSCNDEKYEMVCISGDCKNGIGEMEIKNTLSNTSVIYKGAFKKKKFHGEGKFFFADGRTFDGTFQEMKKVEIGKWFFPKTENTFELEYENGEAKKSGKIQYKNGNIYYGEISDFSKNGDGKIQYKNGDTYEGKFKNGQKDGIGNWILENGNLIELEYEDGVASADGIMIYGDNSKYEGEIKNLKRHGQGYLVNSKGETFEGKWINDDLPKGIKYKSDKIDSKSKVIISSPGKSLEDLDGYAKYVGEFKDLLVHGKGTFYNSEGKLSFKGEFLSGDAWGYCYKYKNGELIYEGEYMFGITNIARGKTYKKTKSKSLDNNQNYSNDSYSEPTKSLSDQSREWARLEIKLKNNGFFSDIDLEEYTVIIKKTADLDGENYYGDEQEKSYQEGFFGAGTPKFSTQKGYYTITYYGYNEHKKKLFNQSWKNILLDCNLSTYTFKVGEEYMEKYNPWKDCIN
jgi:hypothetical protein